MVYNVKERLSFYDYGDAKDGHEFNLVGAFLLDILRPTDKEEMKILSYPLPELITSCLYRIFTRMGEIEAIEYGDQLFVLCHQNKEEETIQLLEKIVKENNYFVVEESRLD